VVLVALYCSYRGQGASEARGISSPNPKWKKADATTGPETGKSPKIANQQGQREVFLYRVI